MRQTTLLGFFKPQTIEIISQATFKATDLEVPHPASFSPLERAKDASLEVVQKLRASSSQSSTSSIVPLSAIVPAQTEVFVSTQCPEATIVRIRETHLPRLRNITNVLLPVRYPDKFFHECLQDSLVSDFSRVLLWNAEPVGWIRCRVESGSDNESKLYIQALGILAPYRGLGFATMLLDCITVPALIKKHNIISVYAHVWEANKDASGWYEKRGFKPIIFEQNYYRRLQPAGAWVMTKIFTSQKVPTDESDYEDRLYPTQRQLIRP